MRVVVVGAGIAGIASALVAANDGHDVTVVERAAQAGGLLRSVKIGGHFFDYGTHIPRETGDAELDRYLFSKMTGAAWVALERIRAGAFVEGRLWEDSEFPSIHAFGAETAERAWTELKSLDPPTSRFLNLEEQLLSTFGETITRRIFGPAMTKFLGTGLGQLSVDAHRLFTSRVIAGSSEATNRLKASHVWWDDRLGFHRSDVYHSTQRVWYPANDGVGLWIDELIANRLQGCLLLGAAAVHVGLKGNVVREVTLEDGTALECDALIWTVGVEPFLRAADLVRSRWTPPTLRGTRLVHALMTRPALTSLHYLTVFDPSVEVFRVTIYDNLRSRGTRSDEHPVTLEYLTGQDVGPIDERTVRSELQRLRVMDNSARLRIVGVKQVRYGFPVPTPAFHALARGLLKEASQVKNAAFAGKGTGRAFFLTDVLREVPHLVRNVV